MAELCDQIDHVWRNGRHIGGSRPVRIGDLRGAQVDFSCLGAGHNVWWLGDGPGDSWMNVFKGTEDGQTITGQWADVKPVGGSGTLTIKIIGQLDHGILGLERIGSTGDGYAGTRWFKPCNDTG